MNGADDPALDGKGFAGDARAGGRSVAAAAELGADFVDVDAGRFGAEADAGQFRLDFLKDTRHDHRFDGPDMVDQSLGVAAVGARCGRNPYS